MIPPDKLCQKRGCPAEATHMIRVCVPAMGSPNDGHAAAVALVGVKVCEEHLDEDDPQGWVTGEDGAYLRGALRMGAVGEELDFSRTWTEGVPLDHPDVVGMALHNIRPVH